MVYFMKIFCRIYLGGLQFRYTSFSCKNMSCSAKSSNSQLREVKTMGESDNARGFLILCDKHLEGAVGDIVSKLSDGSGEIVIKTIEDISSPQTKGNKFADKFKTLLRWAHGVVFVSSSNFAAFIDSKKKDNLPAVLKENFKDSHKVLKEFIKVESKKANHKLMAISVNEDTSLPKLMSGNVVQVLVQESGQQDIFVEKIKGLIAVKLNENI